MNKKILKIFGLGLCLFTLASCGSSNGSTDSSNAGSDLKGNIVIDGSSTVYPITEIIAEEFTTENPDVRVTIAESGTGGGMKKFIGGEIDIINASRAIKDSELEQATNNGMDVEELTVASDGISVVVNKNNTFATELTKEELSHIFRQENPAKYWSEVREGFPQELIKVYTPGTASGTFEFFTEVINEEAKSQREDAILSEDDNILVKGVSEDEYAIGYFGYSYYEANKDKINVVSIDGIAPSSETINDESYLLSRPLRIYFDKNDLEKAEIKGFLQFYLSNAYDLASEVNLVPLPQDDYKNQMNIVE